MKGLRFEWIGKGHYSVVLYFGESFVPVENDTLIRIAKGKDGPPDKFLEQVIENIGTNAYLKDKIRRAVEEGDPRAQVPAMQQFLGKHKY